MSATACDIGRRPSVTVADNRRREAFNLLATVVDGRQRSPAVADSRRHTVGRL